MDSKHHKHGSYAYRWMSQYRVGYADDFPNLPQPKLELKDNDGYVDWNKAMLWQVGTLGSRYMVSYDYYYYN